MTKATPGAHVAVLGASPNEDRYSFKAVHLLKEHGFQPIPVHPVGHTVDGIPGAKSLDDVADQVDTISVYINATISDGELERILKLKPRRVVFNPGAENADLAQKLTDAGIEVVQACTLVLLRTNQF